MADLTPLYEQFKTLREEIHLHVKQHTQMVIFKIISLGAAASFISEKMIFPSKTCANSLSVNTIQYYVWLIPFLAVVFDTLIAGNLRSMYNIGPYIKKYIEPIFRNSSSLHTRFWEEAVASTSSKYFCYTIPDLIFIWVFTIAPTLLTIEVRYSSGLKMIDYFLTFTF
jgi:hypothetical protein